MLARQQLGMQPTAAATSKAAQVAQQDANPSTSSINTSGINCVFNATNPPS